MQASDAEGAVTRVLQMAGLLIVVAVASILIIAKTVASAALKPFRTR